MKKIIKKYGSSLVIIFDAEDQKIFKLKEGDVIDLTITNNLPAETIKKESVKKRNNKK